MSWPNASPAAAMFAKSASFSAARLFWLLVNRSIVWNGRLMLHTPAGTRGLSSARRMPSTSPTARSSNSPVFPASHAFTTIDAARAR